MAGLVIESSFLLSDEGSSGFLTFSLNKKSPHLGGGRREVIALPDEVAAASYSELSTSPLRTA